MPHIKVTMWPGRTEEIKQEFAKNLAKDAAELLKVNPEEMSVVIEEVSAENWWKQVYKPEIENNKNLYVSPVYTSFKL